MNVIIVKKFKTIETITIEKRLGNRMKSRNNNKQNKLSHFVLILMLLFATTSVLAQLKLISVDYSSKLNGTVEFNLKFDGNIDKPNIFMTTQPARLAFDLEGVFNDSGVKLLPISQGNTKSLRIVSTNTKTRAVIDLFRASHHELAVNGNELTVKVFGRNKSMVTQNKLDIKYSIENIDFRRGKEGQGKVIITFNKPGALIDLREMADKISLEINSTQLPDRLDVKLDVIDFATPVSFVDVRTRSGNVKVDISASGNFEHMSYQTGNQYVIEINEKSRDLSDSSQSINDEVEYTGNKVSFNFQDIPVRSVLSLIADASQFNLVVANSVEGSVTLRLINVPWDQALDAVLNIMQLDQRQTGNVIWIAPAQEIADREQQELESIKEKQDFAPIKTIFIQINYAKAEEFALLLTGADAEGEGASGILSSRGSVSFDERTNTLLVSDVSEKLIVVQELVRKLDVAVRQVQIEARIVIATDRFGDELGVKFGVNGSRQDKYGNIISTGGSLEGLDQLNNAAINNRMNSPSGSGLPNFVPGDFGSGVISPSLGDRLNVNLPAISSAAPKWAFSILAADYLLDLELSALETEGRGEVISEPRVVTTNQKKAIIRQGVEIPYEKGAQGGGGGVAGQSTIEFKSAVLSLEVTPLITPDDRVDLTLKINKDSVGEVVPTAGGGSAPSIDTRSLETRVLIGNGQTIVLGGIYEQVMRTDKSRVPVLGNIPGLGMFFRNKSIQNDKAELLIFVTPIIIKESL